MRIGRQILLYVTAIASMWAGPASADGAAVGAIDVLYSHRAHTGVVIRMSVPMINPDGCASNAWYIFPDTSLRSEFVQSMLLTAKASGRSLNLTLSGCFEGYPMIVNVALE